MKIDTVEKFYIKQLTDLYSAETQLCDVLPRMAAIAADERLKLAFEDRLTQTDGQRERLQKLLTRMDSGFASQLCVAMRALIEDCEAIIEDGGDSQVLDSALIAMARRIEHYEIAAYGLVIELARVLGRDHDLPLLEQSLGEEKGADIRLRRIAASVANQSALEEARVSLVVQAVASAHAAPHG